MTYGCIRMAMSIDLSSPVISPKSKEVAKAISSELLIHFASLAIENGLAPINDMTIDASLIEPNGKTLWLSEMLTAPLAITNVLSNCTTQEALFSLFTHPVKLQGTFYYLAPIYCENRALVAIVAFASQTVDSTILLALANAVGREISEKIKRHLCLQELVFEKHQPTERRELSIQEVEKAAIIEAARLCGGKVQEMHQVLNMGRTTLWRKLKQYDINIKEYK